MVSVPDTRATPPTHVHREWAQVIDPVGHPRRRHGVGHQGHPVGTRRLCHVPVDRGVDVHPIGDQLDGHRRVFQEGDDRTGLATIDRTHGVEQVRSHRRARTDRRPRLFVGRLGVADRHDDARIDEPPDRGQRAVAFRRDGHHANGATARSEHAVDLGGVRVSHQRRLVGAATQR